MNDDCHLDDLERFLQRAEVIEVAQPTVTGGAHGQKVRLLLEGGVPVLAKPEAGVAEGARAVRREVAAWVLAREMGLADMVACTVYRDDVPLLDGSRGPASVQVIWPPPHDPDHPGPFPVSDRWRAAIFDTVILHSDRSHNWLAMPEDQNGERPLKLVDHGYAFDFQGGLNSNFFSNPRALAVPERLCTGFGRALTKVSGVGDARLRIVSSARSKALPGSCGARGARFGSARESREP